MKVNEEGFEDSILFDVSLAKNEINGILELKVMILVSYRGLDAEANSKTIDFKLIGNPC